MSQNWETSGGYALPWPVHKNVLENTKPPLMHVSSKDRVLKLTVTAWHESEIFQTRGIECVWTESRFSEHAGDFARGNSVLKIIQNWSEKQFDLPLTVTNWVSRLFLLFVSYSALRFASLEKTRTRFPLPPATKLCLSSLTRKWNLPSTRDRVRLNWITF